MQLFQETAPETDACMLAHGIQHPAPKSRLPNGGLVLDEGQLAVGAGPPRKRLHPETLSDGGRAQFSRVSRITAEE